MFLVVCDARGLPPEGVVEVGLEAAGLALVEEVFGVAGFAVARELLLVVGPRVEPVAGDAAVAAAGLKKRKRRRLELEVLQYRDLGQRNNASCLFQIMNIPQPVYSRSARIITQHRPDSYSVSSITWRLPYLKAKGIN